ncbi:type II RES/Xre toxin-antitoxin system antitoxin [Modicisalibacter luteus]|uniref:Antitoxin Xre/MbcA/ParS toxin-binding domain-containing protein n=1 Tax=Modicisalibacter luteus TaxID=453962 RepID=A0ABV7M430_9GAMM|nr:antitoxin Xre/MbcA/ParS toxin-binding domain-containing protein [Halomonas lutea]GHA88345.1 antitoxin [Halomonas lutea]
MQTAIKEYRPKETARKEDFWKTLGLPSRGPKLHEALNEGVSYKVYTKLAETSGLESKELARYVVISPATLKRRADAGHFKPAEGDRLYRFAEVYKSAVDLFEGDRARARRWLLTPVRGLGGRRPVEMVATTAGSEAILDLIGRLEHGVFA